MKKNEQEYIPQFEDVFSDDKQDSEVIYRYCIKCGRQTPALHNDMCFNCRRELGNDLRTIPNFGLYMDWKDEKNASKSGFTGLIFMPLRKYGVLVIILFTFAISLLMGAINMILEDGDILSAMLLMVFSLFFVAMGILRIKSIPKKRLREFVRFNNKKVKVCNDSSWLCPNCSNVNERLCYCDKCGVLPQLYE